MASRFFDCSLSLQKRVPWLKAGAWEEEEEEEWSPPFGSFPLVLNGWRGSSCRGFRYSLLPNKGLQLGGGGSGRTVSQGGSVVIVLGNENENEESLVCLAR